MKPRVLIVDDEKNIRRTLAMILRNTGYVLREAESGEAALRAFDEEPSDLVILDVNLPGQDGLATLEQIKQTAPETAVMMISGQATVQTAVEATRLGAFDFLEKPLSKDRVLIAVRNALRTTRLRQEVHAYRRSEKRRQVMLGESGAIETIRAQIGKVAPTKATVLVTGPSGAGKELVAQAVHDASPRAEHAFVKVNCAAIPESLIETELFGCVKGAYTGADRNRDGKFQQADGGTLFLDEIGDMRLEVQAKVLRALQEGEIERVGDSKIRTVDVRVVAATNKDLKREVAEGRFREDLFFRLNVIPLHLAPLDERREDVPLLARHFLELYTADNELPPRSFTDDALRGLAGTSWRGNVRELRNAVERLAILSDGPEIGVDDVARLVAPLASGVPGNPSPAGEPTVDATRTAGADTTTTGEGVAAMAVDPGSIQAQGGLVAARREFERRCIDACLDATEGNVSEAARRLGIERSNLHKKMQSHGIEARPQRRTDTEE